MLGDSRYPVQVVWGASDPTLKLAVEGEPARRAADAGTIHTVPAKHFLQEDQAPAVAEHIARLATALRPLAAFRAVSSAIFITPRGCRKPPGRTAIISSRSARG